MQNSAVSMTKESYFELCETLGTQPIDEEIPVEYDDFPMEVQQAFSVYNMLRDEWDTMSGVYLGKTLIGIKDILEATEVEPDEYKFITVLVRMIDRVRSEQINTKLKTEKPAS
jgi:hypothetical protein